MNPDRTKAPKAQEDIRFKIPGFKTFHLVNGLRIFFIQKTDLPVVRLSFVINSGSRSDPQNQKGLSNLLSLCIDEGAGNLNALQIAEEFDLRGASYSIHSSNDITTLSLLVLHEFFEDTLRILADIILSPHFNEKDFERERRKVTAMILQLKDDPDYIANSSFEYLLFGKENSYAYPALGFKEDLSNITIDRLKQTYSDSFSPKNSAIIVAGNIDAERLTNLLEKNFGSWNKSLTQNSFLNSENKKNNQLDVIDKKNSVQTEIRIGHLTSKRNQDEYFKKLLLNTIFGGQFTSRLNLNLREKHGYTYGAFSAFNYYRDNAFFYISTSVGIENTASALTEIFSELEGIRKGISKEELQFAKSSIVKKYPSNFETYGQLVSNIVNKFFYNLPDDYFETYIERVNSVSLDEVNEAAKAFIQSENTLTTLVGDNQELMKQLSERNFGQAVYMNYDDLFNRTK